MKCKYLLAAIATAFVASASAQIPAGSHIEEIEGSKVVVVPVTPLPQPTIRLMDESSKYLHMGYCEDEISCQVGFGKNETLKAGMIISRDMLGVYKDAKVMGVRIGVATECTNVSVFINDSDDVNDAIGGKPKMTAQCSYDLGMGWEDIFFRVPFQISGNYIFSGYQATGTNFIGMDGKEANQNASYLCRNNQWGSIYNQASANGFGALCIQLILGGDDLPENEMAIGKIFTKTVEQGKEFYLEGEAVNVTPAGSVDNYEVTVETDKGVKVVETINHKIGPAETDIFKVKMPAFTTYGNVICRVTISRVNDEDDVDPSNNTTMSAINVIENGCYFPRTVVCEEATSVQCGYCPSGIMVLQSMTERYKDFIAIAVHTNVMGSDDLTCEEYENIQNYFQGNNALPSGIINRKSALSGHPLFFEKWYEQEAGQLSQAKLVLEASKPVDGKISLKSDVTFNFTGSGSHYVLSYVMVENEASGPAQLNYYSGGEPFGGWEQLPREVNILFNHVARGVWDLEGISNSIPVNVTKKETVTHNYEIEVPSSVQDINNVEMIVMLHDINKDLEIIQAAKTKLGEKSTIGIATITPSTDEVTFTVEAGRICAGELTVAVYTADGCRVANENLTPGLYIAHAGRASAKVVVK